MRNRSEFDLSRRQWLSAAAFALLSACSNFGRGTAVPPSERRDAIVLGLPNARFFVDEPGAMSAEQERALVREANSVDISRGGILPTGQYLALSGGGDDGAFGAGLLVGWTEHGDRPKFKRVTGVSTGALTAPFAYLGPEYDAVLTDVYTNTTPSKVFVERFAPVAALWQDALADTSPLFGTIAQYFDEAVLAKIAAEYEKGRLLLIQTTDLDAGVPVLWNIGAIAASGHSGALELIRRLLLASASIPGAFPPVLIDVEANGRSYQEMHVDGGAVSQSFLFPPTLIVSIAQEKAGLRRQGNVAYVIRNSRLTPDWSDVQRATLRIAGKAVRIMINYIGLADLYSIYLICKRAGVDFNVAYIGDDFQAEHRVQFDHGYMNALYSFAYEKAARGYPWGHAPPGFQAEVQ